MSSELKSKAANPGPLGLLGFGMTTVLLNLHNAGLLPLSIVIVAMGIGLFALTTILSWSLYGTRCFEFLTGGRGLKAYQTIFVIVVIIGATLELELVWNIADTLNGFMAIPNLIALLGLSGVVIKLTREHFSR